MVKIEILDRARGSTREFPDVRAATLWVQDEIERWQQAFNVVGLEGMRPSTAPLEGWKELKIFLDGVRRKGDQDGEFDSYVHKDRRRDLVMIDSPSGQALIFVAGRLGLVAADSAALAAGFAQGKLDWEDDIAFKGIFLFDRMKNIRTEFDRQDEEDAFNTHAVSINTRLDDLTKAIRKADELIATTAETAAQQRAQIDAELTTYKAEAVENWRKFGNQTAEIEASNKSAVAAAQSNFASTMRDAQTQVDGWVAAQKEQRQLAKPAKLWEERALKHTTDANKWRARSVVVGIVGLVLAVFIAVRAFQWARPLFDAAIIPGKPTQTTAGTLRPTFHYELIFTGAITLAWLTMYLWAMRILVRLYTTEHHLAIDASARGAMMEAYLGLIEAKAANKADRPIVLQALFRPVQDGMVRDDGPPGITPAALLSSIASAKGGNN
ncbi:DUF6161 domain-containing protein [Sphingomonas sp. DC2300-3]|uniref:DUF6161 domain-containing protein n=1 Tax=unclassified Sphingomonas TaxID=196159 RepID=UPI003CF96A8E